MADVKRVMCSGMEANLAHLPALSAALSGLLHDGLAEHVYVDLLHEPIEVLLYLTPGDLPAVTATLGAIGLRFAWGPREGEPGGRGWACYLPREVPAGGNP